MSQEQADKFATPLKYETHEKMMQFGVEQGWWEEWDEIGPIRVWRINKDKFKFWSQLLTDLKFFKSIGEAKRAGWTQPVVPGTFRHFKKREKFIIE